MVFGRLASLLRAPDRIVGRVETVAGGRICGWAFDRLNPHLRLRVNAWTEDGRRSSTRADGYRADLQAAGFGDGHAGFSFPLSAFAGAPSVRIRAGLDDTELHGSPLCLVQGAPSVRRLETGSLVLALDPSQRGRSRVTGWAMDRADPFRRPTLALTAGGRVITETRATRFRPDLRQAGADPFRGFILEWPMPAKPPFDLVDGRNGTVLATLPGVVGS